MEVFILYVFNEDGSKSPVGSYESLEIANMMASDSALVYSVERHDQFGSSIVY